MKPYPIFLVGLDQRQCIVIGGGHEAEYKVKSLLDCDARVTLISPTISATVQAWVEEGRVSWLARSYAPGDLQGAFLVVAERGDAAANEQIFQEATAVGALVNVMDDIPHCNYVAGSIVRQGALTIAISTSGCAPALAVRLRQRFEQEFGPEYALFLEWLRQVRAPLAEQVPHFAERRTRWYELVDSDVLPLLQAGQLAEAESRLADIMGITVPLPAKNQ